jgi:predicted amidohydrolase
MLQGADLVILPTNYPTGAASTLRLLVPARALENLIYFAVINRVGEDRGFRFIGQSRILDVSGEVLVTASETQEEIIVAEIDPDRARRKRIVHIPGQYELDRIADRRPEMYRALVDEP